MANETIGHAECPLCGFADAHVRLNKKGKPYLLCEECGTQAFARQARAVAALNAKTRMIAKPEAPAAAAPAAPATEPAPAAPKRKGIFDGIPGF